MKYFLIVVVVVLIQNVFAMGDSSVLPGLHFTPNESEQIDDFQGTSSRLGLFTDGRGYQDQQMMDENPELMEERIRDQEKKDLESEMMSEDELLLDLPKVEHR